MTKSVLTTERSNGLRATTLSIGPLSMRYVRCDRPSEWGGMLSIGSQRLSLTKTVLGAFILRSGSLLTTIHGRGPSLVGSASRTLLSIKSLGTRQRTPQGCGLLSFLLQDSD